MPEYKESSIQGYMTRSKAVEIVSKMLMEQEWYPGTDKYNAVHMCMIALRDESRRTATRRDPRD